jgi:HAD superfamily hydrolase (TIGR01490 family)
MKKTAAFFDIDGTLYREGLIAEVFKKLIKYEIIDPGKWDNEVKPDFKKWDNREGDYDNYLLKMAYIYIDAVKGLHQSQVEYIAKQVVSQKGGRVYTFTRDRIKWHKSQGHMVITISGSPSELVKEMALKHGFDDYKGTDYHLNESSIYTGELTPMWDSQNKQKAIQHFIEKYDISLDKSYAYGDTAGDFSMLKSVANPVCINPTRELLNKVMEDYNLREKTRIIVERKDVVYRLNPNCLECYQ